MHPAKTIALIDDDEAVRDALSGFLRSFGWSVCSFDSAEQLLLSARVSEITFLITDVCMPGTSGIELHACLCSRGYKLPTLFITAFATPEREELVRQIGGLALLQKPFNHNLLVDWLVAELGMP